MEDILSQPQSKHATFVPKRTPEKIKQKQFYDGMDKVDQGVIYIVTYKSMQGLLNLRPRMKLLFQQAFACSVIESSTNKKLDQILKSMNAMNKQIDLLKKKQYYPNPTKRRGQTPKARSDQYFNGTCYK